MMKKLKATISEITMKLIIFAAKNGAKQLSAEPIVVSIATIYTWL